MTLLLGNFFNPVILILLLIWGLNGILYAQPIADVLSVIVTVFIAIPLHKNLNTSEKVLKERTSSENN